MTDGKTVNACNEYQFDIGSASKKKVLLYIIAAHQKTQHDNPAKPPNQFSNAVVDNVDVKIFFVEIDWIRYPKDPIETKYAETNIQTNIEILKCFLKNKMENRY